MFKRCHKFKGTVTIEQVTPLLEWLRDAAPSADSYNLHWGFYRTGKDQEVTIEITNEEMAVAFVLRWVEENT